MFHLRTVDAASNLFFLIQKYVNDSCSNSQKTKIEWLLSVQFLVLLHQLLWPIVCGVECKLSILSDN